jgi:hypothetical protein
LDLFSVPVDFVERSEDDLQIQKPEGDTGPGAHPQELGMFTNATSYPASAIPYQDERGRDTVAILAKTSFEVRRGRLRLADEQSPIRTSEVPMDPEAVEQGRESSVRYPSDVGGEKAGADIVVLGAAISSRLVPNLDVAVRAPGLTVTLRVHGERVYYRGAMGIRVGPASLFERAAITYERAYGGASADGTVIDWRNPVGRGMHRSTAELDGAPAPSVEDPTQPFRGAEEASPLGLGALPSWWLPRRSLAGTMDALWQAQRMPLPPLDFDRRFHQVAHPALQMNRPLRPGDSISTHGLHPDGLFEATVPTLSLLAHLRRASAPATSLPLVLDTAVLEPDAERVDFTFRCIVPLGRGKTLLREVRLDVDA